MVTVHREHGLQFVIYVDDHEPAHVHVFGDGELKIILFGESDLPQIVYNLGMKANDRQRAMDVVREMQDWFLTRWNEIHGGER